ncbi:protein RodZ, contains Xre-like HTH and DUF4115 domains [Poseidonocella pacifica]|uniref:Protein RodZ, contains Xre-like HTH and DUF4115 domains n=1 Tax=Poseidonocella pacifica TaxID=871651 RepID=A0A1I0V6T8_9RHOB|nr:helix-turn-helix domain-containing protein [Poseidonocella pacifica]SFA71998.1 protein RodZ, contains Xre-like HTH and DUF4115 domains [Poseidonocella pacifica]
MIRRRGKDRADSDLSELNGFDSFELKLGDVMRGERATMGKSLLDVQRELKIKAAYVAAIENSDPSAFDTPGFIAGYVRSYARYLGMNPEKAFLEFCEESGFSTSHGMSPDASSRARYASTAAASNASPFGSKNYFDSTDKRFSPLEQGIFSSLDAGAIGSSLALVAVIGLLGFGGWSVLQEVQRVQIAPVDQTPAVISELDGPDNSAQRSEDGIVLADASAHEDALDRLYRPQALDVPVLVARDAPIATLDPAEIGVFRSPTRQGDPAMERMLTDVGNQLADVSAEVQGPTVPQVVETPAPDVVLFAVRPAWVRVRAADGSVIFEKILNAGEEFVLPATEEAPTLRAGNSGSLFFKVAGEVYGPAGSGTSVAKNVALSVDGLRGAYQTADLTADPELARFVAMAETTSD